MREAKGSIIPRSFSQTEPLINYFGGTGTRIDLVPVFCTLNLPLFLKVDHLEYLFKIRIATDSVSRLLERNVILCTFNWEVSLPSGC